ncbi:MAG: hypothetical protein B6240_06480 [Desulfobacteraceae bacterium 4572_87]|nr:MAG: hypothetical protein B6240_06480 [Desulfobacteraceae bacterium 4572_87]
MDQNRYRIVNFVADEVVFTQFKEALKQDRLSMARAIEQFLSSYVYCLDSSFTVATEEKREKKRIRKRRKLFQLRISEHAYNVFSVKVEKEKADANLLLDQFFRNYVAFMKNYAAFMKKKSGTDGE